MTFFTAVAEYVCQSNLVIYGNRNVTISQIENVCVFGIKGRSVSSVLQKDVDGAMFHGINYVHNYILYVHGYSKEMLTMYHT